MAEHLIIKGETKEELYATLLPQLKSLVEGESDIIANMANISACIMDTFHFWWVGFYRVIDGTLVLGPFQGAGLHSHQKGQGSLRHSLGQGGNHRGRRC